MTLVSRDPFARQELHREAVPVTIRLRSTCYWCGAVRTNKNGSQYLYAYRIEHDGGTVSPISGLFCSKSCFNSYYQKD